MTADRYAQSPRKEHMAYLAMRHPLTIHRGYLTTFLFGMCIAPFLDDPKDDDLGFCGGFGFGPGFVGSG